MSNKLPKEAIAFAKTLGIDLNDLKPEAEDIWNKLNNMKNDNSIEYESFIKNVFDNYSDKPDKNESNKPIIRPNTGFSIITNTINNDGIKIKDITNNHKVKGKDFYTNICYHENIIKPKDKYNKDIVNEYFNPIDMEIPMILGNVRNNTNSFVIDILIHELIILKCYNNKSFQNELIQLVINTVIIETKIELDINNYTISDKKYNGGLGDDSAIPVIFTIYDSNNNDNNNDSKPINEPKEILQNINKYDHHILSNDIINANININKNINIDKEKSKILISEVNNNTVNNSFSSSDDNIISDSNISDSNRKDNHNIIKNGFLQEKIDKEIKVKPVVLPSKKECDEIEKSFNAIDDDWREQQTSINSSDSDILDGRYSKVFESLLGLSDNITRDLSVDDTISKSNSNNLNYDKQKSINITNNLSKDKVVDIQLNEANGNVVINISNISSNEFNKYDLKISDHNIKLQSVDSSSVFLLVTCDLITLLPNNSIAKYSKKKNNVNICISYV